MHTTTDSLLPHVGAFAAENVVSPAYELNHRPVVVPGVLANEPLFTIDAPNVICEAVKAAEELEDACVLRRYECERNTANCTITLPTARRVTATNLLEEEGTELPIADGREAVTFHPFEIKTIVVERSAGILKETAGRHKIGADRKPVCANFDGTERFSFLNPHPTEPGKTSATSAGVVPG